MLEFLNLKPKVFGLEISDSSIKVAEIRKKRGKLKLRSLGKMEIPKGLFENGEVKNEEELSKEIKKAILKIKGSRIKTKYVSTCLPECNSFLQTIQIPKMKKKELDSAIYFEAENYIPFSVDEVYLDFEIISEKNPNYFDILLVALPKKIVDPYVSCIKKAGLIPYALEIEPYSAIRSVIKNKEKNPPLLLIDFGENCTLFTIFSENKINFSLTSQISSSSLTLAISKELMTTYEKAEKLKIENAPNIRESIDPIISNFIEEIKKCLNYYNPRFNSKIEKIIIYGGGSNLNGLLKEISKEINIPVVVGNPLFNLYKTKSSFLTPEKSLSFATVLGLALREL